MEKEKIEKNEKIKNEIERIETVQHLINLQFVELTDACYEVEGLANDMYSLLTTAASDCRFHIISLQNDIDKLLALLHYELMKQK